MDGWMGGKFDLDFAKLDPSHTLGYTDPSGKKAFKGDIKKVPNIYKYNMQ